jgi:microsomal dipeptidase-like Zn-dependent dipeptidase
MMLIDNLQYANWSEKIFRQLREGGVDAIHVTIAYHENFRETVLNFEKWNRWFEQYPELIMKGQWASDIDVARETGRTAVFFGFQNPSPIEDDIGLVEIVHTLGARFMQLTYNNQSLLATGCYEDKDMGVTRMGKQVIKEMNRVGLVVDMSHSGDRSTIEAADLSERPIAITHANPHSWAPALRNKQDDVIRAVTENGGMLGFSVYPHHLKDKGACTLESFCEMIARTAEKFGADHLGIGTDLCLAGPKKSTTAKDPLARRVSRICRSGSGTIVTSATSKTACVRRDCQKRKLPGLWVATGTISTLKTLNHEGKAWGHPYKTPFRGVIRPW